MSTRQFSNQDYRARIDVARNRGNLHELISGVLDAARGEISSVNAWGKRVPVSAVPVVLSAGMDWTTPSGALNACAGIIYESLGPDRAGLPGRIEMSRSFCRELYLEVFPGYMNGQGQAFLALGESSGIFSSRFHVSRGQILDLLTAATGGRTEQLGLPMAA